jgi:hypothetical protein
MKKLFCLAIVALLAVSFAFTSCGKDDKPDSESLVGTTWSMSSSGTSIILEFKTSKLYKIEILNFDDEDFSGTGSYTYSAPDITLYDDAGDELKGTINGNKLTLFLEDGLGLILTKE